MTGFVDNNQSPIIPGNQSVGGSFSGKDTLYVCLDLSVCLSVVAFVIVFGLLFFSYVIVRLNVVYKLCIRFTAVQS